jgi:hypothetical protein
MISRFSQMGEEILLPGFSSWGGAWNVQGRVAGTIVQVVRF